MWALIPDDTSSEKRLPGSACVSARWQGELTGQDSGTPACLNMTLHLFPLGSLWERAWPRALFHIQDQIWGLFSHREQKPWASEPPDMEEGH